MKYHRIYEVDPAFVVDGEIQWKNTGNGEFILATKGDKKCVLRRSMHIRKPSRDLPKEVYKKYKEAADALQKKQERLHKYMEGLTPDKDHIVAENLNFWDDEGLFVTETDFIPNELSEKFDYTVLPLEVFLQLAIQTAEALDSLHAHGVIHGGLTSSSIYVVEEGGSYVPYLTDFEFSFPVEETLEDHIVTEYQSPERLAYGRGLVTKDAITTATDIFSLAVVMHKWWTGVFPGVDLEHGSVGVAVYLDKEITINRKFDVRIGKNCDATLISLINWMFAKNPKDRPTARQVVDVLSDKLEVPEVYR